jgi:hypothetical protein
VEHQKTVAVPTATNAMPKYALKGVLIIALGGEDKRCSRAMVIRSCSGMTFVLAIAALLAAACGASQSNANNAANTNIETNRSGAPAASASAKCYDGPIAVPDEQIPPFEPPMAIVAPSKLDADLRAVGLDPLKLPALDSLDRVTLGRVMKTFTTSLGIACNGCHDLDDFSLPTPRKRVAEKMWNEFARVLETDDGQPLYCDGCHQGRLFLLDRSDKKLIAQYMDDVFVGKLKRIDGKDHDCGTCHGDPPEFHFLDEWKTGKTGKEAHTAAAKMNATASAKAQVQSSSPKADEATPLVPCARPVEAGYTGHDAFDAGAPAATPAATASATASATPHAAGKPKRVRAAYKVGARAPSSEATCGGRTNPCPLQKWMRLNMAPALAAKDAPGLVVALEKTMTFVPDKSWTKWTDIAQKASQAALSDDIQTARASCVGCHSTYKAQYKAKYRSRPLKN